MPSPTYNSQIQLFDTPQGQLEAEQRQQLRYGALEASTEVENRPKQPVVTRFMAPARISQHESCGFCPTCGQRLPEAQAAEMEAAGGSKDAFVRGRDQTNALTPQQPENQRYSPSTNYAQTLRTNFLLKSRTSPQPNRSPQAQLALSAGNSPQPALNVPIDAPLEDQFVEQCIQSFQHEIFSDTERLRFFDSYYDNYALPVAAVYRILRALQSEQTRLDAARICLPHIPDLEQRWDSLCPLFRSRRCLETYKREVKSFLG